MPRIRPMRPRDIIKLLEGNGFRIIRQKGSHVIMMDQKKTRIVIPVHPGRDVKPSLIRAIIKEAGPRREDFFRFLEGQ